MDIQDEKRLAVREGYPVEANTPYKLKQIRKNLGKTQEEFARAIGIKRSLWAAYEEGRAIPKLQLVLKICKQFKVTSGSLQISLSTSEADEFYGYLASRKLALEQDIEGINELMKSIQSQV